MKPSKRIDSHMKEKERRSCAAKALYEKALAGATTAEPDFALVTTLLRRAMEMGSYEATYAMATWYLFGKEPHVRKNIVEATRLLKLAANAGVPNALYDLAVSYETGLGVRKSERLAFEYYLRAALRGENQSICEVGRCLYWGIGTERNRRLANIWLDRARELGTYDLEDEDSGD